METKILRLLLIDDSPDDAEIAVAALRKGGYLLKSQRVHDLAALQGAIEQGEWDLVVSEYALPHFGAALVLDLMRRAQRPVPLLVLARSIRDADLVSIMRSGARDVILKDQLARLLPAVERELAVAEERAQHRQAAQALKEIEGKHRAVVESAREAICYCQDGMHVNANKAYLDVFEYETQDALEGVPIMNLIDKGEQARFKQYLRKAGDEPGTPQEFLAVRKNGARFHAEFAISNVTIDGEACTQILVGDISKRKAVETKLQYLNQHDAMTGLYNRHYFTQELTKVVERATREGVVAGIVYVDFYSVRQVSNTLGHTTADRFLLAATRKLRESFGTQTLLARCGDHEFAALITDANAARLREIAASVEQTFKDNPFNENDVSVPSECWVASAVVDRNTNNAQKVMASLYRPVTAGSKPAPAAPAMADRSAGPPTPVTSRTPAAPAASRVTATPVAAMPAPRSQEPTAKNEWYDRLQTALRQEAFQLAYQPIVNLHADPAEYFEVLVRMVGPDGALIPAGQFMPPAEESGQSVAIDHWVLQHAIRALAELHREKRKVTFFINLSRRVLDDPELLITTQQVLQETHVRGKHVVLEVDEAAMLTQADPASPFVRAVKQLGCVLCVDNFGRALAATTKLRELPVEYLKLDASLVQNLRDDPVARASLKAVIDVAKTLNKKVIAKGVESAEALSVLWTLGVDYVQGHYFQQAETALDYEFADETTLSGEVHAPNWTAAQTKKH